MKLIEFGELAPERWGEVVAGEVDPFESGDMTLQFGRKERHVAVEDADGTLVASAGLVIADVEVGEERFQVVGIGGVIVRAAFRGRGLARELMEAALRRAGDLGPPFAVLFCREDRMGLYERLDFAEVGGEVRVRQPAGYEVIPLRTMWRALEPDAAWPSGQVVLHSLPF